MTSEQLLKIIKKSSLYDTAWRYGDLNDEVNEVEQAALHLAYDIKDVLDNGHAVEGEK